MKTAIPVVTYALLLFSAQARALDPFSRELDSVEAGNQLYTEQHYDQALERYESAEREVVAEPRVHFNRGAALFKLGRPQEAREAFLRASGAKDPSMKRQNYYNIGNTFLSEGAFRDAISYYRRALEIDPGFDDARFNLELALRALRQQQQQQQDGQSGQPQDQKEDQKEQDQQKDQEEEKDDQQEGDQQDQQQDQQQQQQQQQQQEQQQKQEGQEEQKEQPGEQEKQQQEGQPERPEEQKESETAKEQQEQTGQGQPDAQRKKIPAQLSQAEFEELLDSMRDSEKPFQMHKFAIPEYRQKQVEKGW